MRRFCAKPPAPLATAFAIPLAVMALAWQGCSGTPPATEAPLPSIVVVTIDTLRADHLGAYGYFRGTSPNLDALAKEGVLFSRAVTTMATTLPSHLALWTSRYPLQTGVLQNGNRFKLQNEAGTQVRLLAEMLKDLGYTTAGFVSATPVKKYTGIGVGFDSWGEPNDSSRDADVTVRQALDWLEAAPPEPFLLWIHLFDPHKPWAPPAPYDSAFTTDQGLLDFLWSRKMPDPTDPEIQAIHNAYDGEILFADTEIGRVFAYLRDSGKLANTALVVAGDHGEGLGQHNLMTHGEIYNEQLFVPLMMRFPDRLGLNGRRIDSLVSLTDVLPTLVDNLSLPISESDRAQFVGLNALLASFHREYAFAQRVYGPKRNWGKGEKYSLVGDDWKYNYSTRDLDELYDMRRDAHETANLAGVEREVAGRLKHELLGVIDELTKADEQFQVEVETSEDVQRELRSLGYIQ
jgi:arylsulfatase A-like enzyme